MVPRLCAPNLEYQSVNPTTQVALFSLCQPLCTSIINVTWIVYQGTMNASSNIVQWTPYPLMDQHQNTWFFGRSSPYLFSYSYLCRLEHQQLHCHQSAVPRQSHRRLLAIRSGLHPTVGKELKRAEFRHQSATAQRLMRCSTPQRHHQHVVHPHLLTLARRRRHQGLLHLQ